MLDVCWPLHMLSLFVSLRDGAYGLARFLAINLRSSSSFSFWLDTSGADSWEEVCSS